MSKYTKYLGKRGEYRPRMDLNGSKINAGPIDRMRNIGGNGHYIALGAGNGNKVLIDAIEDHVGTLTQAKAVKRGKSVDGE